MYEAIILKLKVGQFDISKIIDHVSKVNYSIKDFFIQNLFLIFAHKEEALRFSEKRKNNPDGNLPYVCLVNIKTDMVVVNLKCEAQELKLGKKFILWLLSEYDCDVTDEEGNDITSNICDYLADVK